MWHQPSQPALHPRASVPIIQSHHCATTMKVIPIQHAAAAPSPADPANRPAPGLALFDRRGRNVRDLRISVTDRCNFRCVYCMPREVFDENYTFLPQQQLLSFEEIARLARVFVGLGVNYTKFFSTDSKGALAGTKLKLEDSWGLAAHAGLDFRVSEKAAIRVDVRWIDIDSRVRVDGARMGTANIDPLVYGAAYVMKF